MVERNDLPTGNGPQYPWRQRYFGRSVAIFVIGMGIVLIGAWLDLTWLGATGVVVGLLGLIGILHGQQAWAQNVADAFRPPRRSKHRAPTLRDESRDARRPNER